VRGLATVLAPSRTDRAFERLYRRYAADVYRYVLAVLQNAPDAEDATQTAFLSAYRAYERGERPERPLNWLIAIAHNVCRQRFRESARRPRLVELQDNDAVGVFDDETPNADDIKRALGFLAFNQRAALVMRELQGHSYEEIGRILGLSTSAVETLLFRARRAMREQLEGGLTCGEAELALSKRADGRLSFSERGRLRAHLRECSECAALDRRLRFRRRAIRSATLVPLPSSLSSIFGGGASTGVGMGAGMGAKAAAVVVAGVLGGGVAGDATKEREPVPNESAAAATGRSAALEQRPRANRIPSALRLSFERARAVRPSGVRRFSRTRPSTPSAAPANAGASAAPVGGSQAGPAAVSATAPDPRQAEESRAKAPADPNVPVAPTPVTPPAVGTVPEAPLEAPKVPEPPKLPELPKPPELANPGLPSVPHVPELPALPPTQIPESPGVQLPTTPTLSQP
jgi:RNA polymerase sigma-70 factor, ECF subfamily